MVSDPALKLPLDHGLNDAHPIRAVVEAGQVGELLAAVMHEDSPLSSSRVSRQSAEKPGATTAMRYTPLSARASTVLSV